MSSYCTVSSSDRFEFLYEYYHNYQNILSCERHCVIYMIENFMMKNHWEKYCKYYNSLNKNSLINRISECMSKGEAIDFVFEDEELPEYILSAYKNYIAMRVDFRILSTRLIVLVVKMRNCFADILWEKLIFKELRQREQLLMRLQREKSEI